MHPCCGVSSAGKRCPFQGSLAGIRLWYQDGCCWSCSSTVGSVGTGSRQPCRTGLGHRLPPAIPGCSEWMLAAPAWPRHPAAFQRLGLECAMGKAGHRASGAGTWYRRPGRGAGAGAFPLVGTVPGWGGGPGHLRYSMNAPHGHIFRRLQGVPVRVSAGCCWN